MHLTCLKVMPNSEYCLLPITYQIPSYPRSAEKTECGLRVRCRTQNGAPNSCLRRNCLTSAFWLWKIVWIWGAAEFIAYTPFEKSAYITQNSCFHFHFLLNDKLQRPLTTVTFLLQWHNTTVWVICKEKKLTPLIILEVGKLRDAAIVHHKRLCVTP